MEAQGGGGQTGPREESVLAAVRDAADEGHSNEIDVFFVQGMLLAYLEHYAEEPFRVLHVEEEFDIPMSRICRDVLGREWGGPEEWTWAGKVDGVVEFDGAIFVLEHKTTSASIEDPGGIYWASLGMSGQDAAYEAALNDRGYEVAGTIFDAIRKPVIKPKKLTKKEIQSLEEERLWQGLVVEDAVVEEASHNWRETPALYGMRVYRTMCDNPRKYFQRQVVHKTRKQVAEFITEVDAAIAMVEENRASHSHIRHLGACFSYNRACPYVGLCQRKDNPESSRWTRRKKTNNELTVGGHYSMTYSRKSCLQLCPRKHHYQYDLKLERKDKPRDGNLYKGSLAHKGLEQHFKNVRANQRAEAERANESE